MDLRELPTRQFVRHPWEVARARFFLDLLWEYQSPRSPVRVLDVGAGDGYVARLLLERAAAGSQVVCYDQYYTDELLAAHAVDTPGGLHFTRERPAVAFDVLMLLDVLEHVADDCQLLSELVGDLVSPGGRVLVSVPAWQCLFTRHDVMLGHCRRYRPRQLQALASSVGLELLASGGLFHGLLPVRVAAKLGELSRGVRSKPAPGATVDYAATGIADWHAGKLATTLVGACLATDTRVSRWLARLHLPRPGLSTWVLGRKR